MPMQCMEIIVGMMIPLPPFISTPPSATHHGHPATAKKHNKETTSALLKVICFEVKAMVNGSPVKLGFHTNLWTDFMCMHGAQHPKTLGSFFRVNITCLTMMPSFLSWQSSVGWTGAEIMMFQKDTPFCKTASHRNKCKHLQFIKSFHSTSQGC